ncbi:putative metallophosphoesterase At3g03305 [Durio zibethinus]|uniref:Metallophosphoesterase At3g03305 n=1 Tax=Durio zibethinus TaxID=66656 RepID=A0A6P5YW40_DURZI|nr:putative metallophosphoesterase At3g03305 [Durio zibethinus]XP_022744347.1 putative metallophosphoesterase At3g03305 [Durio zibethinus]
MVGNMGILVLILLPFLLCLKVPIYCAQEEDRTPSFSSHRTVIDLKDGPESVVWVVQLSDLHFSVHHPDRAIDFKNLVPPALSMINPSLVLITGDLTDGKSKDLLVMKQNEEEWMEYKNVMDDVVQRTGLDKNIFYDLRGNHDNFGVPVVGGSFDFYSKYSINGQFGRSGHVNSVTLQAGEQKYLFVGLDSTMSVGLRGPTNLFGHPTDQLLTEIDLELSQWDSHSPKPVSKISFGHFPLSFSASSQSGKTLKDIFLKHSLSAYVCGHLHTSFGKNLKRHHLSSHLFLSSQKFFQFNVHQIPSEGTKNCSFGAPPVEEFWEWEMGDWRKSRAMRILAIDRGHVSFADIDFMSGSKKTIILPTFPLDSRFMSKSSSHHEYECEHMLPSSYETVRALVFSVSPIVSVVAKIYDSRYGNLDTVMEVPMTKHVDTSSRGDLYTVPWNYKAFEDSSADRFWLQIEATDVMGRTTMTELRPFSINGLHAKVLWTWKEFFVMGCQWAALYYPILWLAMYFLLLLLLIPRAFLFFSRKRYTHKNSLNGKSLINGIGWVLQELCRVPFAWFGFLGYLFYLILFPWFAAQVFTDGGDRGYMTYMGWVVKSSNNKKNLDYIGSPDIMVVVLPHLIFVVLPAIFFTGALAAERAVYRDKFLSISGKKEDDYSRLNKRSLRYDSRGSRRSKFHFGGNWIRSILLILCLAIFWKHFKNCRALMKAYEMNPLLHFPAYTLGIPLLLVYVIHQTRRD